MGKDRKKKQEKFITKSGVEQQVDMEINYDKIENNKEENQKFINLTNSWKYIYKKNITGVKRHENKK